MSTQSEEQEILELWDIILKNPDVRKSLVYLWEHRKELKKMEARVQTLESHVLEILRNLPNLRKHSYEEFRAMCERLVGHLHNVEPSKEWVKKIQEDLDFIVKEADMAQARATERIFAKKQTVIEPIFNIVKLVAEFYQTLDLTPQKVEEGLNAKGLLVSEGDIKGEYLYMMEQLDIILKMGDSNLIIENLIIHFKLKQSDLRLFVIELGKRVIGKFQLIIEALPREIGLVSISQSDSVSNTFHEYVREMYASVGVIYYPLRLYRDDLNSAGSTEVLPHTHAGAYQKKESKKIEAAFPNIYHGVIIRVHRPSVHIGSKIAHELKLEEWDNAFEFVYSEDRPLKK